MTDISYASAFAAGILTFLSPCLLPLIPAYLGLITGMTLEELQQTGNRRRIIFFSLVFIAGFSLIFILLGLTATVIGSVLLKHLRILNKVAGVLIILLGLHMAGIIQLKFLYREGRIHVDKLKNSFWTALFMGMAFAFGWAPCIGPILASILALAANKTMVLQGALLLAIYSLGIGVPFFLAALLFSGFLPLFQRVRRYYGMIERVAGLLLVILGGMFLFGIGI